MVLVVATHQCTSVNQSVSTLYRSAGLLLNISDGTSSVSRTIIFNFQKLLHRALLKKKKKLQKRSRTTNFIGTILNLWPVKEALHKHNIGILKIILTTFVCHDNEITHCTFNSARLLSHVHNSNGLQSQTAQVYDSECFLTASSFLSVFYFLLSTGHVIKITQQYHQNVFVRFPI